MGRDIGDIIAGSILRHAVLGVLTGGVGNVIALAVDAMDVMDVMDAADAYDAYDAYDASDAYNAASGSADGQIHFGSSVDAGSTQGPVNIDDHGNAMTIPQSGTDVSKPVSPNDVYK